MKKNLYLILIYIIFFIIFGCEKNTITEVVTPINFQLGINMDRKYWGNYYETQSIENMKQRMSIFASSGVKWVTIYQVLYMNGINDSYFYNQFPLENPGWKNYSQEEQAELITHAHELGLKIQFAIEVCPLVPGNGWYPGYIEEWRGEVCPTNPQLFFSNMTKEFVKTARLCQKNNVEMLNLGQELIKITTPQFDNYWTLAIDSVRTYYDQRLSYCLNGGNYSKIEQRFINSEYYSASSGFCSLFDILGITMYPNISDEAIPTINSLRLALVPIRNFLESIHDETGKKVIIGETSCPSVEFPLTQNYVLWAWNTNVLAEKITSEKAQANYLEALKTTFNQSWIEAVFWHNSYYNLDNPSNEIMLSKGPSPLNSNLFPKLMLME